MDTSHVIATVLGGVVGYGVRSLVDHWKTKADRDDLDARRSRSELRALVAKFTRGGSTTLTEGRDGAPSSVVAAGLRSQLTDLPAAIRLEARSLVEAMEAAIPLMDQLADQHTARAFDRRPVGEPHVPGLHEALVRLEDRLQRWEAAAAAHVDSL